MKKRNILIGAAVAPFALIVYVGAAYELALGVTHDPLGACALVFGSIAVAGIATSIVWSST